MGNPGIPGGQIMRKKELFQKLSDQAGYDTVNLEGAPAFKQSTEDSFLQTLMTNTVEGSFYMTQHKLAEQALEIHQKAFAELSLEDYAKALKYARIKGYMRLQPILGLVQLSTKHFGDLPFGFTKLFIDICRTPKDVRSFIDLCQSGAVPGRTGLSKLKGTIIKWLKHTLTEYWAIKYKNDLEVIIRMVHPSPEDFLPDKSTWAIIQWIINESFRWEGNMQGGWRSDTLIPWGYVFDEASQLHTYDMLKSGPMSLTEAVTKGRLPYEAVVGITSPTREEWLALLKQMPIFAMTRHLATMERHEVLELPEAAAHICEKLTDPEIILKSMMFPHHFFQAYRMLGALAEYSLYRTRKPDEIYSYWGQTAGTNPKEQVRQALLKATQLAVSNIPSIPGDTLVAIDTSGSMHAKLNPKSSLTFLEMAALFGGALFKQTTGRSVCWGFDTQLFPFMFNPTDDLFVIMNKIMQQGGGGTCLELPFAQALQDKVKFDSFIGITDAEEWSSGNVYRGWGYSAHTYRGIKNVLRDYRKQVNPNIKAIFLRLDPYDHIPTRDSPLDFYVYGWSDVVPQLCATLAGEGFGSQWAQVREISL